MSDSNTLNDIIKKFQEIESMLLEADGEISEEIENQLVENENNLSSKLDGYQKFSIYLNGQSEYLKSVEEQYSKRRKTIENSIKRLRERMLNAMIVTGNDKIKTTEYNYSISESEKWIVNAEVINDQIKSDLIDQGLGENIFKTNLSDIKSKYKNEKVPDWIKIEKNKFLRVK
tara:strand:- start:1220 stop:1738 length:519 start_codon:yes stop_codon:yes gene_type:complete